MATSTVIKAGRAGQALKQVSTVDLAEHLNEARATLDRARVEAATIVARAREQARRLEVDAERRGREDGYRAGEEAGRREGFEAARREAIEAFQSQQRPLVEVLVRVVGELDERKLDLRTSAEHHLLEFAVSLARRMTFAIGVSDHEAVRANLIRALDRIELKTEVTVRVHPSDEEAMGLFAPEALAMARSSAAMKIVADESILPGGCVVATGSGEVDASLDSQADELVRLLLGGGSAGG